MSPWRLMRMAMSQSSAGSVLGSNSPTCSTTERLTRWMPGVTTQLWWLSAARLSGWSLASGTSRPPATVVRACMVSSRSSPGIGFPSASMQRGEAVHRNVLRMPVEVVDHDLEAVGLPQVVAVEEDDHLRPAIGLGEAPVACRGDPAVRAAGDADPRIGSCVLRPDVGRPVGRAVVEHDQLPRPERLREHAVERGTEVLLAVVSGDDDRHPRDIRRRIGTHSPRASSSDVSTLASRGAFSG